jgi:uncharacterized protein YdeI (BOF family)
MKKICILFFILILILSGCNKPEKEEISNTITYIRENAVNGQMINSTGKIEDRIEKRKFRVTDGETSLTIDLHKFKKETKTLHKNDKVIFSGRIKKKAFKEPEAEIFLFQKVEGFK